MAKKNYDPAVWKAQKEDQLKQAQETVLEIARNFDRDPTQIAEMLAFQSRFHRYSVRNSMLIYKANPHATFTASFAHFKSMGWSVQKGQKGIQILVPARVTYIQDGEKWVQLSKASKQLQEEYHRGTLQSRSVLRFKVGYVFDISQTNCPPEQYPKIFSMGQSSKDHRAAYEGLVEWAADRLKCPVRVTDVRSISLRGYYNRLQNAITLSDKLNDTQLFSTCLHEVAHAILHNSPDAMAKSTAQIEFEADALSIMLETHAGIALTDIRKGHLADNYREMVSSLSAAQGVDDILQPVADIYTNMVGEIEGAITKYLDSQNVTRSENVPPISDEAPAAAESLADKILSPEVVLERMTYSKLAMFASAVMNGTYDTEIFEQGVDEVTVTRTADRLTFARYDFIGDQICYNPRIEFAVDDELHTLRPLSCENTERQTRYEVTDNSMRTQLDLYIHSQLFPTLQGFVPVEAKLDGQSISLYPDGSQINVQPVAPTQGLSLEP